VNLVPGGIKGFGESEGTDEVRHGGAFGQKENTFAGNHGAQL
jgi:hypothetical protein